MQGCVWKINSSVIASIVRTTSDYSDFFIASEEEAKKQCEAAGYIIETVEACHKIGTLFFMHLLKRSVWNGYLGISE